MANSIKCNAIIENSHIIKRKSEPNTLSIETVYQFLLVSITMKTFMNHLFKYVLFYINFFY